MAPAGRGRLSPADKRTLIGAIFSSFGAFLLDRARLRLGASPSHGTVADVLWPSAAPDSAFCRQQCLTADKPGSSPRRVQLKLFETPQSPRKLPKRCAIAQHFNLHAGVAVGAGQREQLERLCHYLAPTAPLHGPPPLQRGRPRRAVPEAEVGRWHALAGRVPACGARGASARSAVERLCALIWKPRVNTIHYHSVFAPAETARPPTPAHRALAPERMDMCMG